MKQESGKKRKLWLWITLAAVAVVVAAGVIAGILFLNPGDNQVTDPTGDVPTSEVYWNIDKIKFTQDSETGLSTREKGEDGLYHFRFATQGKVVEMATADKKLVNYIDVLDACGLVLDADGLIIDVLEINTFAVETAKGFYVKKVTDNTVVINSSVAMNGMELTGELSENVCVMDVRPDSEALGQPIALDVMDLVYVYGTEENPFASVFLAERPPASPLYLRVDRFYDSTAGVTTRVPDENGVYTIPFAINGKIEQLKCKDKDVVTLIDEAASPNDVMGLTFDAEGYISGMITASTASRSKKVAVFYHITAINGNSVEATCIRPVADQGKVVNFTFDETTQIIMYDEGCGHFIGERVPDLKLNDYIVAWTDMDDKAVYVRISRRQVEGVPMYFNITRMYDSTGKVTTRIPDENGYYVFQLASKGKVVTVKTKDKDMATKMDAASYQMFGLKVQGGIAKEFYSYSCICGGTALGSTYYCTQVMGTIARIVSGNTLETGYNLIMTPETEVYDMTGVGKLGSKTTLQEGDRVITARTMDNKITHVYVLDRYRSGSKLYYNLSRKYSDTTLQTTRTPDAEGYYVFDMACEGKQVQVKTKSKDIATIIDKATTPQVVALKVSNGIVRAAYGMRSGVKLRHIVFNSNYVSEIASDKTVSCVGYSNGQMVNASYSYKMAKNCQVYNVSNTYNKFKGEKTTLKVGDKIQALRDVTTGELTHIWVINRAMDTPLYLNANRVAPTNGVTNRVPDADGYYSVELFADGKVKTYRTKSKELISRVDSYSSTTFFTMTVKGDIIQKVDSYSSSLRGSYRAAASMDIMEISGKTLSLKTRSTGATKEITYTSKTKIYNVEANSPDRFKATKLKKGDRITVYMDREGEISYIFVLSRNPRGFAKCSHCNKTVWWEPFTGSFDKTAGTEVLHYYLTSDRTDSGPTSGYEKPETRFVLDLNGKTHTSTSRNFIVYSELTIMDSVGGGILQGNCNTAYIGGNIIVVGGSLILRDGVTLRKNDSPEAKANYGGNIYVKNNVLNNKTYTGSLTIKNAKLQGWDCLSGDSVYMDAGTKLTISGGTITGDIWAAKDVTIKLSGSPKIQGDGINLTSGAKISESKLSGSAKVVVQANGIFTKKLSNASAQKAFYTPEFKYYPIQVKDGALWTDRDPSKPDFKEEPAIPAKPSVTSVSNANLSLDANKQAKCPVCNKKVKWTAITKTDSVQSLANGSHYYLPADVTFTKADHPYIQVIENATACLHLNGHNITATKAMAVMVSGTLNIMGNGTVSGNGYDNEQLRESPHMTPATAGTDSSKAVLNLYGGTYIKSADNDGRKVDVTNNGVTTSTTASNPVMGVYKNGGTINLFKGATVEGSSYSTNAITVYNGKFNMYGGTVNGGSAHAINLTAWSSSKSGTGNFYGGTVNAGTSNAVNVYGSASSGSAYLNIYGGTFNGSVVYNANCNVILAGNPVMTNLKVPAIKDGAYQGKITLGKLTDGAKIAVSGSEAITFQNKNAASYLKYFESLTEQKVAVVDHAISFYEPPDPVLPDVPDRIPAVTEELEFVDDTKWAVCAVCQKYVKWTAVTQKQYGAEGFGSEKFADGTHLYLAEDINYTGSSSFFSAPSADKDAGIPYTMCFHLNGHNFTGTNSRFVSGGHGLVNVLGSGVVSGNAATYGATVYINTNGYYGGGIVLHSGTYTKQAGNALGVVASYTNGGRIEIKKDAKVVTEPGELAVKLNGGKIILGYFKLSGTVEGGYVETAKVHADKQGPVVLELDGANIEGGVKVAEDTTFVLSGEVKIGGFGLDMTSGAKILESNLSGTAKVPVKAKGAFSAQLSNAEAQKAFYEGSAGYQAVDVKEGALWTDVAVVNYNPPAPQKPGDANLVGVDQAILNQMYKGNTIDNSDTAFAQHKANGTCPICGEGVTWTALEDGASIGSGFDNSRHYYIADSANSITKIYISAGGNLCLWLNKDITITDYIRAGATANIFGAHTMTGTTAKQVIDIRNGGIANLYGGKFVSSAATKGVVYLYTGAATLNMYQGATIGPDAPAANTAYRNVFMRTSTANTFNMFGGTIQNGVGTGIGWNTSATGDSSVSGNLDVGPKGTFNMYGGTIKGGTFLDTAANKQGGNIWTYEGAKVNIYGGVIENGKASSGGNIYVNRSASNSVQTVVNICGGTIKNGDATNGGNVYIHGANSYGGTLNVSGFALISGGGTKTTEGSQVTYSTTEGGNVYVAGADSKIVMTGGVITGGEAKRGGNVYTTDSGYSTFNFQGGAVTDGDAENGGNVYGFGKFIMSQDVAGVSTVIAGGKASKLGGNLYVTGTKGTCEIKGGTIVGDVAVNSAKLKISGAPKILLTAEIDGKAYNAVAGGLQLLSDNKFDITGLTADARIAVTAAKGQVFTVANTNATSLLGCFSVAGETLEVNGSNEIVVKS